MGKYTRTLFNIRRWEKKNIAKNIFKILTIDNKNIIDLYLDEKILSYLLIEDEKLQIQKNITKFLKDFSKLPQQSIDKNLKKFVKTITTKVDDKKLIHKVSFLLSQKNTNQLIDDIFDKEESYNELNKKIIVLEEKLEQEEIERKKKNTEIYRLRSLQTLDKNELINLQHHIGLYAHDIEGALISFNRRYNKSKILDEDKMFKLINRLTLSNKKILAINKLITKEGFLKDSEETENDLINFIYSYVHDTYIIDDRKVNIKMDIHDIVYNTIYSPFEF